MKVGFTGFIAVLATAGLAALGGGFAVFAGYDDSPGGVLLGVAMVIVGVFIGLKAMSGQRAVRA